ADDTPLEERLIEEHLERSGLGRVAAAARAKARVVFRDPSAGGDGWVEQWRRTAHHLNRLAADLEELERAQQALAEDLSEENLQWCRLISERVRRESLEAGLQ